MTLFELFYCLLYNIKLYHIYAYIKDVKNKLNNKNNAITINKVSKSYNNFNALNDISFNVEQGEFFALLGPNGAGKTTLISALAGLHKINKGKISIMGFDTNTNLAQIKRNLGLVPQELVFDPFFTVRESLLLQSGYYGIKNNHKWIDEIIDSLNLSDKANTNMRKLSGGMKRRAMVASSLVHKPPVIVLDEPTAGVDVELRQNLWRFISKLNKDGHTILLTTHYLEEAQSLCNKVALLNKGNLVALDKTADLLNKFAGIQLKIRSYILPVELNRILIRQEGQYYLLRLEKYSEIGNIINVFNNSNINIDEMEILQADLQDVFLQLTQQNN